MERMNRSILLLAGLIGLSGLGAADSGVPATQPAGQPAAAAPANDYRQDRSDRRRRGSRGNSETLVAASDPYAVLRTRSIFVKGNQTIASDPTPSRGFDPGGLGGKSGSTLVFNGVIMLDDEANALIENLGSSTVSLVKSGDLIAAGKVSAITFDDLTYEVNGQQRHVSLGQNMDGVIPSAPVAVAPTTMPTGAPAAPGVGGGEAPAAAAPPAASTGGSSSAEDILARMKAKRNQELGIK